MNELSRGTETHVELRRVSYFIFERCAERGDLCGRGGCDNPAIVDDPGELCMQHTR